MGAYLTELGKSVSFGRLSLKGKCLWPMLLAASDDQGRGLADADVIKWHVCPNVDEISQADIEAILAEMVTVEMIVMYSDSRGRALYQIINWWLHQRKRFARRSLYEAPEGWTDKVFLVRGKVVEKLNWDQPGGFTQPLPGLGDNGDGSYAVAYADEYAEEYAEEYSPPKLKEPKEKENKLLVSGENCSSSEISLSSSFSSWVDLYKQNINQKIPPFMLEEMEAIFNNPQIDFKLWREAIQIACAQQKLTLAYIKGILRNKLGIEREQIPGSPSEETGAMTTRTTRKLRKKDDDGESGD